MITALIVSFEEIFENIENVKIKNFSKKSPLKKLRQINSFVNNKNDNPKRFILFST